MFKTVQSKLLVPILCAILLASLITGIVEYQVSWGIISEAFHEDGGRSATHLREYVDNVISKAKLDLLALSVAPSVKHLLQNDETSEELVEGYIMALVDQHGIYNSITILNTDGIIVASTSGSAGGDRSDRAYFQESMKGNYFISEVELSRQTGRLATFISIPIRDVDSDAVIGVALAVIRLEELNSRYVVPISLLGDIGYAMIATSNGTIIAHRDEEKIIAPDDEEKDETDGVISEEMLAQLLSMTGDSVTFETTIDGTRYMAFAEKSEYTDWYSIIVCPLSEFNAPTDYLARLKIVLLAILIILLTVFIWYIVRGITKALGTTVKYSEKVANGILDADLIIERNDEVGTLAKSLRIMVDTLKGLIAVAERKTAEVEASAKTINESIKYASKIQKYLLPKDSALQNGFSDYSIIWEPRDVVGGDIYWAKNFDGGTVLCVCDCTGHGTSGALLTMLVVSAFEDLVKEDNCSDTADILWSLDQRLKNVFSRDVNDDSIVNKDGCDLAVLFIAKDGTVNVSSAHTNVFVCDGKEVNRIKGQRIFVGVGDLQDKKEVDVTQFPANPNSKFYIASDGLYDQPGGEHNVSYCYDEFTDIILKNHNEKLSVITEKVWKAFEQYRGGEKRVDDFELISFKL